MQIRNLFRLSDTDIETWQVETEARKTQTGNKLQMLAMGSVSVLELLTKGCGGLLIFCRL